jgi:hypothetical protein
VLLKREVANRIFGKDHYSLPEQQQVGILKYTLLHTSQEKMVITETTTVAEAEILLQFPNVEVKCLNDKILRHGSSALLERLAALKK